MAKEFDKGGKGVSIAGQDYALWFSEEGVRIAPGRSAFGSGRTLVPWANAAAMTAKLLRDGTFATQDKIDAARDNEFWELAETLGHLRRDFNERAEAAHSLPSLEEAYHISSVPDHGNQFCEKIFKVRRTDKKALFNHPPLVTILKPNCYTSKLRYSVI